MRFHAVWSACLLCSALIVIACHEDSGGSWPATVPAAKRAVHQEINSVDKVLILGSSVDGGLQSREAQAVAAYVPAAQIDVVTPEEWKEMTAVQFMAYRALIIGDRHPRCLGYHR
jgi:hypothetical protein